MVPPEALPTAPRAASPPQLPTPPDPPSEDSESPARRCTHGAGGLPSKQGETVAWRECTKGLLPSRFARVRVRGPIGTRSPLHSGRYC